VLQLEGIFVQDHLEDGIPLKLQPSYFTFHNW